MPWVALENTIRDPMDLTGEPRIVGQVVENLPVTNESGAPRSVRNNGIDDFFETGQTFINNISISDASQKLDYRLSVTSLNQTGILPGTSLDRSSFNLNVGVQHNDKLKSRFGIQYHKTKTSGTGASGANDPNIISLSSFSSTGSFLIHPEDESGNQINHIVDNVGVIQQPLWIRHENLNERDDDRFIGYFQVTYSPLENLNINGRIGIDLETINDLSKIQKEPLDVLLEILTQTIFVEMKSQLTLSVNYENDISENINLNIMVGFTQQGYNANPRN